MPRSPRGASSPRSPALLSAPVASGPRRRRLRSNPGWRLYSPSRSGNRTIRLCFWTRRGTRRRRRAARRGAAPSPRTRCTWALKCFPPPTPAEPAGGKSFASIPGGSRILTAVTCIRLAIAIETRRLARSSRRRRRRRTFVHSRRHRTSCYRRHRRPARSRTARWRPSPASASSGRLAPASYPPRHPSGQTEPRRHHRAHTAPARRTARTDWCPGWSRSRTPPVHPAPR